MARDGIGTDNLDVASDLLQPAVDGFHGRLAQVYALKSAAFPVINSGLLRVGGRLLAAAGKQRGQHLLEAAHEKVCLTIALDQRFDGTVFAVDLLAQEVAFVTGNFELVLKLCDIARRLPCRG